MEKLFLIKLNNGKVVRTKKNSQAVNEAIKSYGKANCFIHKVANEKWEIIHNDKVVGTMERVETNEEQD